MSHQKVRGTDWQFPETSGHREYDARESVQRGFIGFRLAHDHSTLEYSPARGTSWLHLADHAGSAVHEKNGNYNRFPALGFRLVREEK